MGEVEKRIIKLLEYFRFEIGVYPQLSELSKKPLDEENINNIVSLTKARKVWIMSGDGDPFLEHDEYMEKYIKTDDELNWLIDRKVFEQQKPKE